MSALMLMSLLGLSLFLPHFDGSDSDEVDPLDPTDPVEPTDPTDPNVPEPPAEPGDVITGTDADENLTAFGNDTVDGGAGDDTLSLDTDANGAQANGQAGNDTLIGGGVNGTLNGGEGDDTFTDLGSPNLVLNGDTGNDTFELTGPGQQTANGGEGEDTFTLDATAEDITINAGFDADTITLAGTGNIANGGFGQDVITVTGTNTANGQDGDDTITATDIAGGTDAVLTGGGAEDVLVKSYSGDNLGTLNVDMDGGNGEDILQSQQQLGATLSDDIDLLRGGGGLDTFNIGLVNDAETEGLGDDQITGVTIDDFDPDEDTLIIDASNLGRNDASGVSYAIDSFTLAEADDASYTDVIMSILPEGALPGAEPVQTTLRLFGVSNLLEADVTFATP